MPTEGETMNQHNPQKRGSAFLGRDGLISYVARFVCEMKQTGFAL